MIDYASNKATAKEILYDDIEKKPCSTIQKFDTVEDFRKWCKFYSMKYDTFSNVRLSE